MSHAPPVGRRGLFRRTPGARDTQRAPRPRVFISYTGHDLAAHAAVAVAEATALEWEPVDHRHWEPNGRSSVGECLRRVDGCDALIVIVGGRHGWVPSVAEGGDGVRSITHLEVARARVRGIAVMPMLLEEPAYLAQAGDSAQRAPLDAFRAELRSTLARFFTADPESVREAVRLGLGAWDGRKNDDRLGVQRAWRMGLPLAWIACAFLAWMGAGPALWAGWTQQARMSPSTWLLQPATLAAVVVLLLMAFFWTSAADRGRPQWMYRLFPLSRTGTVLLGVTAVTGVLMAGAGVGLHRSPDPFYEQLLRAFMEEAEPGPAARAAGAETWRGARFEREVESFRTHVLPVAEAKALLTRKLSLADVRGRLSRLAAPGPVSEGRMQLLLDVARFEELALARDAGTALRHYEATVEPVLPDHSPALRAQAKYAMASWLDTWAFTNRLEQIDRTGAPKSTGPELARAWEAALSEVPSSGQRPPRIRCASLISRTSTLMQLCGVTGGDLCRNIEVELREAGRCARDISDNGLVRTADGNLGTWLMANDHLMEAFTMKRAAFDEQKDVLSGLHAWSIQSFGAVVPAGQGISPGVFRKQLDDEADMRRRGEFMACADLLDDAAKPGWMPDARACRVAFTCFMTDNPAAHRAVCSVPEPDAAQAVSVTEGSAVTLAAAGGWETRGTVETVRPASQVAAECDGSLGAQPVVTVNVQQPGRLVARVKSAGDSTLVVRGPGQPLCADDSPAPSDPKSKDAGVSFDAVPGRYEFFVGQWAEGRIDYRLLWSFKSG